MAAHHAFVEQDEAERVARRRRFLQRASADEIPLAFEIHRPGEARLQRRGRLIHVLAVKIHAGLQAQRVASAQPCRGHAQRAQLPPQGNCLRRRQNNFETVFACVTGAREHGLTHMRSTEINEIRGRGLRTGQRRINFVARLRPLHGDDREIAACRQRNFGFTRVALRGQPRIILVGGASVDDQPEPVRGKKIHD